MIVKLTSEQVKLIGATDAKDFAEKFLAFVQEANELKDMADSPVDTSALEKRIADLEASAKTFATEARVTTLVTEGATKSVNDWATSDAGKKIIGAEASRITLEAIAAIGTTPAKPSPANPAGADVAGLVKQGKFEEAYNASKDLQEEFPSAKHYAAFAKAEAEGRVTVGKSK